MKSLGKLLLALGWVGLLVSAVAVVWSKHQSRGLFVELQKLQSERDALDTDWGRLRLEQSTSSSYGRVEQIAREQLRMLAPSPKDVRIIEP